MMLALSGKNKVGFITGLIKKPSEGNLLSAWKCNNDVIASWIINSISKEIAASLVYNGNVKEIWDELKDRLHTNAYGLSGGQQQRVCIARCLAIEPDVILMDEPTSALDPISTLRVEELVQDLKQNYSIIMVTHNMQQAARVSDKTAFFLNGYVNEYDDTDKIFSNPSDKQTEDYISGRFG